MFTDQQWGYAVEGSSLTKFAKEQKVFSKNSKVEPFTLYILLSSDAKSKMNPKTDTYLANSVV